MAILEHTLRQYLKHGYISFHTPGHKGRREFFEAFSFPEFDLTELPGLDMLHNPSGVILEAQQRAAQLYGSEECFFMVNGGTAGNHAMLLALTAAKPVRVVRDAHRSVMAGLILSGLQPSYCPAIVHPEFNLALGLDVEMFTNLDSTVGAWHLTYPTYYGTLCDLKAIVRKRERHYPDCPVFVDQAHGAHYLQYHEENLSGNNLPGNNLSEEFPWRFPQGAVELGADLVLLSVHKSLSSLTQSALLHVQGPRIDRVKLKQALEMIQSSSPSYLFLASLEKALETARCAEKRWSALYEAVLELHHDLGQVYRILNEADSGQYGISQVDWTKLLVNTRTLGVKASSCVAYLREHFRIEPELWDEENILFMIGIGNEPQDVQLLQQGLHCFADSLAGKSHSQAEKIHGHNPLAQSDGLFRHLPLPPIRLSPRAAFMAPKRQMPLKQARGKICGETISPYPPGIPLVVMGEEITAEVIEVLENRESFKFQGWDGADQGMIWVVEDGVVDA